MGQVAASIGQSTFLKVSVTMKLFYQLVANTFVSVATVTLTWFALGLWVYVETKSVFVTSLMYGIYLVATAVTGVWFGALVDRYKKQPIMLISSLITLVTFCLGLLIYLTQPAESFRRIDSWALWALILIVFGGVVVGNIRNIVMPTLVTLLVPDNRRDKANGIFGVINGVSFLIASVLSGFLLSSSGMYWIFWLAVTLIGITVLHVSLIRIPEKKVVHVAGAPSAHFDVKQTLQIVKKVPGLFGLILFTCFNNFLGGVFMPLMDPYGLSLVSLKTWGIIWGFLSLGFIFGGLFIAKWGLGKRPLRTLFLVNIVLWIDTIFFTIQPSIWLLCAGMLVYICLVPFIEASEHTVIQKIVPRDHQGRVFGFAQSIESAASPLTTFGIGPLAQYVLIPFMTTGEGAELIGPWFGVGAGRGIALLFSLTGIIGLLVTLAATQSRAYRLLSARYAKPH